MRATTTSSSQPQPSTKAPSSTNKKTSQPSKKTSSSQSSKPTSSSQPSKPISSSKPNKVSSSSQPIGKRAQFSASSFGNPHISPQKLRRMAKLPQENGTNSRSLTMMNDIKWFLVQPSGILSSSSSLPSENLPLRALGLPTRRTCIVPAPGLAPHRLATIILNPTNIRAQHETDSNILPHSTHIPKTFFLGFPLCQKLSAPFSVHARKELASAASLIDSAKPANSGKPWKLHVGGDGTLIIFFNKICFRHPSH
ncbi:hypothetical protein PIB30_088087 [Stylosanthes scabra]|uniref:Uncharacterized protein n=1 Tax=Stylosanthes scabra TaxID=79078 RepID=A0ABU6RTI3_9FABA|nr:hypothetical protein [Stylosanthes scabra]